MGKIFFHAYDPQDQNAEDMLESGFRILPSSGKFPLKHWNDMTLPSWTARYLVSDRDGLGDAVYLLTFRPFSILPDIIKQKYFKGDLALLPFPGSLIPWGSKEYISLSETLYNAIQFPMLRLVTRNEENFGIRVPQSGWFHEPAPDKEKPEILEELLLNTYVRTSRWDHSSRTEDPLLNGKEIDAVAQTLFNTTLPALDLYNKPMARNVQILDEHFKLLLDGRKPGRRR